MYKIVGADGKEYGPVSLEQLKEWVAQGRVNAHTRVRAEGTPDWKLAGEVPELQQLLPRATAAGATLPPLAMLPGAGLAQQTGLAVTSLVLGILSLICFGLLTGIPAIICGHLAYRRARRSPEQYGGAGLAIAGFVTGYVGIFMTFVLAALLLPALGSAKSRAQSINCVNNLKQVGLAFKVWEMDHNDQFPFNVSTNAGGTMELCAPGKDGVDKNGFLHVLVMSNELSTPRILVCAADSSKSPAPNWQTFTAANLTYQIHVGTNICDTNPSAVLAVCPIHGNVLHCDGSVEQKGRPRR